MSPFDDSDIAARSPQATSATPGNGLAVTCPAHQFGDAGAKPCSETLAGEVPIALVYNEISHAVMLASPADLEDFALGFSLSEGILAHPSELYDCEIEVLPEGIELRLSISAERFAGLKERRRNLAGRTGCGLCGVESLQAAIRYPIAVTGRVVITPRVLRAALAEMSGLQPLHRRTHAVHGAAWADRSGTIQLVREDVGRHNALDKLLGAMARQAVSPESGFALLSSRASVEMVQKAAACGVSLLVFLAAPTALAVKLAEQAQVTLVGAARNGAFTVYTYPERLQT